MKIRFWMGLGILTGLCACGNTDHPTFSTEVQSSPNIYSVGAAQQQINLGQPSYLVELSQFSPTYRQWAQIRIDVVNPENLELSKDSLLVFLNQGDVSSVVRSTRSVRYQVRETFRSVRWVNPQESVIQVSLLIEARL